MRNFFHDNQDILFHLENPEFPEIIALTEDDFADKSVFPDAPEDVADALDNSKRVLELLGEIAAQRLAPMAAEIDKTGAVFKDGKVELAEGTMKALRLLAQAGVMGFTLPRKYGGLNFSKTLYAMAIELISRADASLMTLFGLQGIAETINNFGTEEQREKYLRRFSNGEVTAAMALTEPDAGSDLFSLKLKAEQDEQGNWTLNGVKRFITNGCGNIVLVLARSEPDIPDARGLSLYIYERDSNVLIRRIESKHGIHGSPTCEMQFNKAPVELLGQTKRGLITYTMALMNSARLAVAAQAVGIMEAAYHEAREYASKRMQFGMTIDQFPAIFEMLTEMRVNIEAARTLLYESSRIVDRKEAIVRTLEKHPERKRDLKAAERRLSNYEQLFTPLLKFFATEIGNRLCYDAMQVHGGVGYTNDFAVERLCRDMRVTSIYEGTSQIQIFSAVLALLKNVATDRIGEYEEKYDFVPVAELHAKAQMFAGLLDKAVKFVLEKNDPVFQDIQSRRLAEMASDTLISYLMCIDALRDERKKKIAELFIAKAQHRVSATAEYILSGEDSTIRLHKAVIG